MLPLDLVRAVAAACEKIKSPYFVTGSVASKDRGRGTSERARRKLGLPGS